MTPRICAGVLAGASLAALALAERAGGEVRHRRARGPRRAPRPHVRPRPAQRRPARERADQRRHAAVPGPARAGLLRRARRRPRALLGDARQRLRGGGELEGLPLRLYRITPDRKTRRGGSGTIRVGRFIALRDPDGHVPFGLERGDRTLTGGDFDIEPLREDRHGDLWFGDEIGPWLLHADRDGRLLEPPIALPVGLGAEFAFPFQTIEDVLPVGRDELLVLNDNNFPFSNGRSPARPDNNQAIVLRVPPLRG